MDTNGHTPLCEDYVSFETAKLLKEKGFIWECRAFWKEWNGKITLCHCSSAHAFEFCYNSMLENYNDEEETNIAAPTLQMAMKWLREVHHIFIRVIQSHIEYCACEIYYNKGRYYEFRESFNSYEQACEDAINYCLENLI